MELNLFELFDWKILLICGVGTSFIVGAINTFTGEGIRVRYILPIVTIIVVFLNTTFVPGAKFSDWQNLIFQFLFNASVSMLFYLALGKWTVDKIMEYLKKQVDNKLGNTTPVP
jgi:Na+/H+ antiporter NhaC